MERLGVYLVPLSFVSPVAVADTKRTPSSCNWDIAAGNRIETRNTSHKHSVRGLYPTKLHDDR